MAVVAYEYTGYALSPGMMDGNRVHTNAESEAHFPGGTIPCPLVMPTDGLIPVSQTLERI